MSNVVRKGSADLSELPCRDLRPQSFGFGGSEVGEHLSDTTCFMRCSCNVNENLDLNRRLHGLWCVVEASAVLRDPVDSLIANVGILEADTVELGVCMSQTPGQTLIVCLDEVAMKSELC